MPRSVAAYLSDIVEACDAVTDTLAGIDLTSYESTRAVRSAVERELTIIGEAVNSLLRLEPDLSDKISHARKIVGFRNLLVHDYAAIIDATVWAIAKNDAPVLRDECAVLMEDLA